MTGVWAIARLTFAEGVRMRIVVVFLLVLLFLVLRLPFALQGDATLTGRLQNFIDYAFASVSILLSLSTIMLATATLSNEFRTRSLHLVVTKPISRLHILLGKWLGVSLLNIPMLLLCGLAIYGFAQFIASRPEGVGVLDRMRAQDVVLTARVAEQAAVPYDEIQQSAEAAINDMVATGVLPPTQRESEFVDQVRQRHLQWRTVLPGSRRVYEFAGLPTPKEGDESIPTIQVSYTVRATPLPPDEQVQLVWQFVDPNNLRAPLTPPQVVKHRQAQIHQFLATGAVVRDGRVAIAVANPMNRISVYFEEEGPLQILYTVSTFEENFGKTMLLMLLRLSFLAAVGVFFSTFTSSPVAAFCTLVWYVVSLGRPFWLHAIGANIQAPGVETDPYGPLGPAIRFVLVPAIRLFFPDFTAYSGVSELIEGLYISNDVLGWALLHTLVFGCVLLFVFGWLIFRDREVAGMTD